MMTEDYKGKPLNHMLAAESEQFYGQMMTEDHLTMIESKLNQHVREVGITGVYIKVEKYDDNTFTVTPIIGEPTESKNPAKLEDWLPW